MTRWYNVACLQQYSARRHPGAYLVETMQIPRDALIVAIASLAFLGCDKTNKAPAQVGSEAATAEAPQPQTEAHDKSADESAGSEATGAAQAPQAEADKAPETSENEVVIAPKDGPLADQLATAVKSAKDKGLDPYAEFSADWCGPCNALIKYRHDPQMEKAFAGVYVARVDVTDAKAWNGQLQAQGFDASAIPVFYELDADAHPTGRKIDGGAWGANIPKNMAPPLATFFGNSL